MRCGATTATSAPATVETSGTGAPPHGRPPPPNAGPGDVAEARTATCRHARPGFESLPMNTTRLIALSFALATSAAGAFAAAPLTRAEVRADYEAALRAGEIPVGELGIKPNEAHPERYPNAAAGAPETRAQVKAELAAAVAAGELPVGETGRTARDLAPGRYAPQEVAAGASRAD